VAVEVETTTTMPEAMAVATVALGVARRAAVVAVVEVDRLSLANCVAKTVIRC
jgi:phosphoribosylcarboxyaminoimidazole (NCAIR) mutase